MCEKAVSIWYIVHVLIVHGCCTKRTLPLYEWYIAFVRNDNMFRCCQKT